MTKYLLLYRSAVSPQDQIANASPEQAEAGMEAWMTWANTAGSAMVDLGSPVAASGSVGATSSAGTSGNTHVGGYSIMQADSADALKGLLEDHPHLMLEGSAIEIFEFLELSGAP